MILLDRFPSHVFLSYSSSDERTARKISESLTQSEIVVWRDRESLAPGTANWERTIRAAISRAYSVILLASPNSRDSAYVQTELALARAENVQILPLWVAGKTWEESAPFSAMQAQYIDVRGRIFRKGLANAIISLKRTFEERLPRNTLLLDAFGAWYDHSLPSIWQGLGHYLAIPLDERPSRRTPEDRRRKERAILVNPTVYPTAQAMLDDIYVHYLQEKYSPLSYGSEWLLFEDAESTPQRIEHRFAINPKRVLAPWRWLIEPLPKPLADITPGWLSEQPSVYGLVPHSIWRISAPSEKDSDGSTIKQRTYGLAVNDRKIIDYIMTGPGKQPHPTLRAGFLKVVELGDSHASACRYQLVVLDEWVGHPFSGRVLCESEKPFDPSYFQAHGHW